MFVNKLFIYLTWAYLILYGLFNAKFSAYFFHIKAKILADFQTCISVPLVYMVKDMGKDFRKWETLKVLLIKLMLVDINVVLVRCLTYLLVLFLI